MTTYTYTGTLVVVHCCQCGVSFGLDKDFQRRRREDHDWWYCPAGHVQHYTGPSEADKLRQELERERRATARAHERADSLQSTVESTRRAVAATKGHLTRIKRRVARGVCPCCQRQFQDLHRHMQSQHPEWEGESS